MKKRFRKLSASVLAVAVILGITCPGLSASAANITLNASDLVSQLASELTGLTASAVNGITVEGAFSGDPQTSLSIVLAGETINWEAQFSGRTNGYTLSLIGSGTFNLNYGGAIENTGVGGAISVSGVTLNIESGGSVSSPSSGIAIFNDSTSSTINISGGTVTAGNSSAIQSNGANAVVTVSGGMVVNAAASNINPTINMTAGTSENIVISGGEAATANTAVTSYVIQSTGNVTVSGGKVTALAGRAINLIGMTSELTVTDGIVSAAGGIAVSTATTNPGSVTNAKVFISGGWVYTESGTAAVQVTGASCEVRVTGGYVTAAAGYAVRALSTASSAAIGITGGFVFAYGTGIDNVVYAPDTASVTIAGTGVAVAWNSAIINPAYIEGEDNDLTVLPAGSARWHGGGAWTVGNRPYSDGIAFSSGANTGFFPLPVTVIPALTEVKGLIFDIAGGQFYIGSIGAGNEHPDPRGTSWDWVPGTPGTGTLTLDNFNWVTAAQMAPVALTITGGSSVTIDLIGVNTFVSTGAGTGACGINCGADVVIRSASGDGVLNASAFSGTGIDMTASSAAGRAFTVESGVVNASSGNGTNAHGMNVGALTISGGEVNASSGGPATTGAIYGIYAASLTLLENTGSGPQGVLTASGNSRAINSITGANLRLPPGYTYLKGTRPDGGNAAGFSVFPGGGTPYVYSANNCYIRIQARTPHSLTIIGGSGGGSWYAGQAVGIYADSFLPDSPVNMSGFDLPGIVYPEQMDQPPYMYPPSVETFGSWSGGGEGVFADAGSETTIFTMPDADVTVTVEKQQLFKFWASGGYIVDGSAPGLSNRKMGYYPPGEVILLGTSLMPPPGQIFQGWYVLLSRVHPEGAVYTYVSDGNEITSPHSIFTMFTTPDSAVQVEARWVNGSITPDPFTLMIIGGMGHTQFPATPPADELINVAAGTGVVLEPDSPSSAGMEFSHWEITVPAPAGAYQGSFINGPGSDTQFVMGEGNITITAMYKERSYTLTVLDESDNVLYTQKHSYNETVTITADPPPARRDFGSWEVIGNNVVLTSSADSMEAVFEMPADDVTIKATYKTVDFIVTVIDGTGSGLYHQGDTVLITAEPSPGRIFTGWTVLGGGASIAASGEQETTFLMPGDDVTIRAEFGPSAPHNAPEPSPGRSEAAQQPPPASPGYGDVSRLLDAETHMQYIRGVGPGSFEPDRSMTRAEAAQMFFNLLLDQNAETADLFPDEPAEAWHARAVSVLTAAGILAGYPDGGFHPDAPITRAEFCAIAVRFAQAVPESTTDTPFGDVPVTHWAYNSISSAVRFGWIVGHGDGRFDPDAHITRAQAVTVVNRMLGRVPDRAYIDSHPATACFTDVPGVHWAYYDIMEASIAHDYSRNGDGIEIWIIEP